MTRVLVGSCNPVKADAARVAFSRYFEDVESVTAPAESGVSDQPIGDETFRGARNRARALAIRNRDDGLGARFCVGIEGGVREQAGRWFAFGCMCIVDEEGRTGFGTSPWFELPAPVVESLLAGDELGDVIDRITGQSGSKQKGGAIEFFTRGAIDRRDLYVQGLLVAIAPFLRPGFYFPAPD